jgi:RNA recognition motif-containing protein
MITLFVGGFPLDIDEMDLAKLFMPFGQISTIKIIRDKKTRICKGYAFIEMVDMEAATEAAANLNGRAMGDRNLAVKISEEKPAAPAKSFSGGSTGVQSARYVKVEKPGNLIKKKRPRRSQE